MLINQKRSILNNLKCELSNCEKNDFKLNNCETKDCDSYNFKINFNTLNKRNLKQPTCWQNKKELNNL